VVGDDINEHDDYEEEHFDRDECEEESAAPLLDEFAQVLHIYGILFHKRHAPRTKASNELSSLTKPDTSV
jgi:hypothetical protein